MTRQERNQAQNKMTTTVRKPPSLANPRAVLRSRLTNDLTSRVSRQSQQPMSAMSPEARAAMVLAREDTKDSVQLRSRPASLPRLNINNNANNNNNKNRAAATTKGSGQRGDKDDSFNSDSRSRDRSIRSGTVSDFNDSGISSIKHQTLSSGKTTTTTAASTGTKDGVSNMNDIFETDNNNNNSNNNKDAIYRRNQLRPLSRISRSQTPSGRRRPNGGIDRCDDDGDKSVEDDFSPGRTFTNANNKSNRTDKDDSDDLRLDIGSRMKQNGPKSFVLALDAALEANRISRLRGDITDQNNESSTVPNTVRALNGGRLSNAQEVVVNVCHGECDQELVFHDDDIESLDTARAASEIRVNTWLEYNQDFPQDDAEEVTDFFGGEEGAERGNHGKETTNSQAAMTKPKTTAAGSSTGVKSTLRVPTARIRSAQVVATKSHGSTSSPSSSTRGGKPPVSAIRKDSNNNSRGSNSHSISNNNNITDNAAVKNNSAGSGRSKSGSAKDNSSRFGSAASNDSGSRRSSNPPAVRRETLARKTKS